LDDDGRTLISGHDTEEKAARDHSAEDEPGVKLPVF
jgi:hypothetical protein